MENQNSEIPKKSLFKRKVFIIPTLLILSAFIVAAAVYISQVTVNISVPEPLTVSTADLSPTVNPNDQVTQYIEIPNTAPVNEFAQLTWIETSNPNNVSYSTDLPKTVTIPSGGLNASVLFSVSAGSNPGTISGIVNITRTASP